MHQITVIIVCFLLIIFIFIPMTYLKLNNIQNQDIKRNLNLSAKVVAECANKTKEYAKKDLDDYEIDKDKLLNEFYDVLYKNYYNDKKFNDIKSRLAAKILVCYDKFFVADYNDKWSAPYFFTTYYGNEIVYLNIRDNTAYTYKGKNKVYKNINNFNITEEKKNNIIINQINSTISKYTYEKGTREGLKVEIRNPNNDNINYKIKYKHFNVLDGISFFVVYAGNRNIEVNKKEFKYSNYNIVGYTFK